MKHIDILRGRTAIDTKAGRRRERGFSIQEGELSAALQ
jgi:hypothetical protein